MIHKKIIEIEYNSAKLDKLEELLTKAAYEVGNLYEYRSDGTSKYLVDDVVVDIYSGMIVVYYHEND